MTLRTEGRPQRRGMRPGQAMMELAAGLFAVAFLLSALVTFALYIVRSLDIQNHLRGNAHGVSDKIELEDFAAQHVFGLRNLHIKEPFGNTDRTIR